MAKSSFCAGSIVFLCNSLNFRVLHIGNEEISDWGIFLISKIAITLNLPKKCSIDSLFDCLEVRSMYLSNVILRGRMNVSSMIFQTSTVVIISILRCGFLLHINRLPSVPN